MQRRVKLRLLLLAAALAVSAPALAATPQVDADAFLVQDGATGEILLQRDARERLPIASITKLATALVVLEHTRLDELVTVTPRAASVGGSTIHLRPGERITVRDLLAAALIESANDAANALADHVSRKTGAAFVTLMNAEARALGLRSTSFAGPDGLDAATVSTARDVTRLARVAMRVPVLRRIVRRGRAAIAGGRTLHTWNDLLGRFPGLLGVKTGHTTQAGWSQVAAARRRGVTVYATILGSPTRERRNAHLVALLEWGLSRYRVVSAIAPGRVYARAETPYGREKVALVAARPLRRAVRIDRPLLERVVAPAAVALPVRRGQKLGEVRVYQRGRLLGRRTLVASASLSRPDLTGRITWYAGQVVENVWSWLT